MLGWHCSRNQLQTMPKCGNGEDKSNYKARGRRKVEFTEESEFPKVGNFTALATICTLPETAPIRSIFIAMDRCVETGRQHEQPPPNQQINQSANKSINT